MGEITEALRRARAGGVPAERDPSRPAPREPEPARPAPAEAPPRRPAPVADAPARPAPVRPPEADDDEPAPRPAPPLRSFDLDPEGQHAIVSHDKRGMWPTRVVVVDGRGAAAESVRHLALRLKRELETRGVRSCAIVSALRHEGKTTLSCNLALALATFSQGRRVALVDLDLRKPTVAKCLELPREVGIEEVLRGERSLREACISIEKPALDVFPVKKTSEDAHEVLAGPAFEAIVHELERRYETVLYDTAPVLLVPDAAVILRHVPVAVAVARAGRTLRRAFEHLREILPEGRLIGSILNEGELPTPGHHYGYYGEDEEGPDAAREPGSRSR